jgi:hypothetical protein
VITRESAHREKFAATKKQDQNTKNDEQHENTTGKSFGLPAILEFTRVLITLIDPNDHKHTDTLHRSLALKLATTALEVGGSSLAKWVAAGYEIEKNHRNIRHKISPEINLDMNISTDQPSTVLRVGANGASYATEHTVPDQSNPITVDDRSFPKNVDFKEIDSNETQVRLNIENDFRKIAIKIKHMMVDDFCKHLFKLLLVQNVTNSNPPSASTVRTVTLITRTITALFSVMETLLLPQKGWFLQFLMKCCEEGIRTADINEMMPSYQFIVRKSEENIRSRSSGDILHSAVRELYIETLLQVK